MGKIIAIGGGEIASFQTLKIDREIITQTGKKNPKLLFIPTASNDSEGYYEGIEKYFGKKLGCKTDVLYLIREKLSKKQIEEKIFSSDIVYVGGGNTWKLMTVWRKFGVDKILEKAHKKGVVMAGLSAGSICWFKNGNSDSRKFKNKDARLIKVSGLGLVNALHCPHYDVEPDRKESLKQMMKKTTGVAIVLDNCAAIEIIDKEYRIVKSKPTAKAFKIFWNKGKYYKEEITVKKEFQNVNELLKK